MKIIRPVVITDAMFISSNLPETDEPVYSAGTTYSKGDRVIVIATHRIYESLEDSNTGNYPPDNIASQFPSGTTETIYWKDAGATNKWRAFDQAVGNQATHATVLEYEILPGELVDSISFQNLEATEISITMTDPTDGIVYENTISLISSDNVEDWFDYYFEDILKSDAGVLLDLPLYVEATIDISITNGGSTVKCGEIVPGTQRVIGRTIVKPRVGITDYSRKSTNPDNGEFAVEARAFSKTMSCSIRMKNEIREDVIRILSLYRATPIVWIAVDEYASMNVYGFYRDFQVELTYLSDSDCSLEIEGLT